MSAIGSRLETLSVVFVTATDIIERFVGVRLGKRTIKAARDVEVRIPFVHKDIFHYDLSFGFGKLLFLRLAGPKIPQDLFLLFSRPLLSDIRSRDALIPVRCLSIT